MMRVATELGYNCLFLGARREEGTAIEDEWQGWRVRRLGREFPLLNGTRLLVYVRCVIRYNWDLFWTLRRERPALVHASDVETMPASVLYKWIYGTRLICNVHDNISQRYDLPAFTAAILNVAEGLFILGSSITLVPENFRRDALPAWCRRKITVIRNTPVDPGFAPPSFPTDGKVRILMPSWLDWGRGLRALLELSDKNPRIDLKIAGEGSDEIIAAVKRHRNVTFLGYIENSLVLEETKHCHFVAALYDPSRVINRFAASNKVAEALAVGRPVLVNCEMEVAKGLKGNPCMIAPPYSQSSEIGERLIALVDDCDAYSEACRRARAVYDEFYGWDRVREQIRLAILGDRESIDAVGLKSPK
jgi:glycosyltransferase involved in cell wall biosynthesis